MPSAATRTILLLSDDDILRGLITDAVSGQADLTLVFDPAAIGQADLILWHAPVAAAPDWSGFTGDGAGILVLGLEAPPVPRGVLDDMPFPLRLGLVVDQIRYFLSRRGRTDLTLPDKLAFGPYRLTDQGLAHAQGGLVRLTEKERAILGVLYLAPGHATDRKTLLDKVWGYAAGVETHTLETHIYRLRQKIERDPAQPAYLLTDDNCYRLAVAD